MAESIENKNIENVTQIGETASPDLPTQTATSSLSNKKNLGKNLKNQLKKVPWTKVDLSLLVASLGCFSYFVLETYSYQKSTEGPRGAVATLAGGAGNRKPAGEIDFQAAGAGTVFQNMDALWVTKGKTARLDLLGGGALEVSEKTLLLLKLPFKGGKIRLEDIRVITGTVKFIERGTGTKDQAIEQENSFGEIPNKKKAGEGNLPEDPNEAKRIAPAPGLTIFTRSQATYELNITWPNPKTGFLVVSAEHSPNVIYEPLKDDLQRKVVLQMNETYYWQILGANKKVIYGPYKFNLKLYDENEIKRLMSEGKEKSVQVIWE